MHLKVQLAACTYMSIGTTTMKRWSVDTCCSVVGWYMYQQNSNFGRKKSFEIFLYFCN